jgi:hypothetical protein
MRAPVGTRAPVGMVPLPAAKKWRAITLATLVLVPAYWSMLAGLVVAGSEGPDPLNPAASVAFGLALIPFVFIVLAFTSEHPRAPAAVLQAMVLAFAVGTVVSALAADAVTGIVAGVGAGGVVGLRADAGHSWRARALAVVVAAVYVFVLVRMASALALLPAPIFPFTAIGIADHLSERRLALGGSGQVAARTEA